MADGAGADGGAAGRGGDGRIGAQEAAERAASYLEEMVGQETEAVTAVEHAEDGWRVRAELVELARVPDTTDILGCYDVELDAGGEPVGYRRTRRYRRSQVGEN
jgi:hypothetical protein